MGAVFRCVGAHVATKVLPVSILCDHPMAGNNHWKWIASHGCSDGTGLAGVSSSQGRKLRIGDTLTSVNQAKRRPALMVEGWAFGCWDAIKGVVDIRTSEIGFKQCRGWQQVRLVGNPSDWRTPITLDPLGLELSGVCRFGSRVGEYKRPYSRLEASIPGLHFGQRTHPRTVRPNGQKVSRSGWRLRTVG